MTLTGKDRSRLKSLGQTRPDDARLGKGGLGEGQATHLRTLLARQELIKVRFADVEGAERKALAEELAAALEAELVAVVGRTALLYRANPELDASKRVL